MNLQPPSEHQLLVFWVSIFVLLAAARLLGRLSQRLGQPAVVGELAAGLLLGPTVLGRVAPDAAEWLFPADAVQTAMLFTIGWVGVSLLLVSTGFETDLGLIRRLGRVAIIVSTASLVIPLAMGYATGAALPDSFLGESDDRVVFALFIAAALAISSLPVIAKILSEMQLLRRDFGQLTLAAGMANDVVGWILLGVIAGLAQAGEIDVQQVLITLAGVGGFFLLAFTLGQALIDFSLRSLLSSGGDAVRATALVIVAAVFAGAITQWLGVEAVLGAFVVGILLGRSRFRTTHLLEPIDTVTSAFLAPIFFATAGLRVDLGLLFEVEAAAWALVILAVASISKFGGAMLGAVLARRPVREGAALGVGLNARGALEIVIATIGLSIGVLNQTSYTAIVLMAIVTSVIAPPLLRSVLRTWQGTPEETARLIREETLAANVIVRSDRLLLPTRGGLQSIMAAQILDLAWPEEAGLTLFAVGDEGQPIELGHLQQMFDGRRVDATQRSAVDISQTILAEAKLGYGAIGLGVTDRGTETDVWSPIVNQIVLATPIPVVIVRRGRNLEHPLPWAYARALVPVAASSASRAAQEIAFSLSAKLGTEIVLSHVVTQSSRGHGGGDMGSAMRLPGEGEIGRGVLDEAARLADRSGARPRTVLRSGVSPAEEILDLAELHQVDLVVLGSTRRLVDGRVFLGHTVEQVIDHCDATVVVVVMPPTD